MGRSTERRVVPVVIRRGPPVQFFAPRAPADGPIRLSGSCEQSEEGRFRGSPGAREGVIPDHDGGGVWHGIDSGWWGWRGSPSPRSWLSPDWSWPRTTTTGEPTARAATET